MVARLYPYSVEPSASGGPAPSDSTVLRILATTDVHMHLLPWDYYADRPSKIRGLSLLAGLIEAARAEVPHSILLDNGDFLQGSPIGDFLAETAHLDPDALHPMIAAMNHLGYDAACVGNHEFGHGLEFMQRALSGAAFPALSANILLSRGETPADDKTLRPATALITREIDLPGQASRTLRIGLIGLTPSQVINWERVVLGDQLQARTIFESAAYYAARLRRQGADLVIALAHSGLGDSLSPLDHENSVMRLAKDLKFDAILAGHVHSTFPGSDFEAGTGLDPVHGLVFGTPTVMPGFNGSHLGVIDLHLRAKGASGWQVCGAQVALRPVFRRSAAGRMLAAVREDKEVRAIAMPAHRKTRRWARRKIGETSCALHSYFALVSSSPSVQLVAMAQRAHVEQALHGSVWEGLPVLAAAAPFRTGGRGGPDNYTFVAKGPISLRNAADLYSFPNTITGLLLTGTDLKEWLERAAAQFNTIAAGSQGLEVINPDMPGFDFDLIYGLSYEFDLSSPPRYSPLGRLIDPHARRVARIFHEGAPLDPAARFILATNSYRVGGGGGYDMARASKIILHGGQAIRSILASYIATKGTPPMDIQPVWRFSAMKDTSVTFLSAPAAAEFCAEVTSGGVSPAEMTEKGFQRFPLTL